MQNKHLNRSSFSVLSISLLGFCWKRFPDNMKPVAAEYLDFLLTLITGSVCLWFPQFSKYVSGVTWQLAGNGPIASTVGPEGHCAQRTVVYSVQLLPAVILVRTPAVQKRNTRHTCSEQSYICILMTTIFSFLCVVLK